MRPGTLGGPGLPGRVRIGEAQMTTNAVMESDEFNRFIALAERSGDRLMEDLANKFEDRAQRYAPMRTGRLKRSIKAVLLNNNRELRIVTDVPYARVMEEGSRPHPIHGVRATFTWKGGTFVWNDPRYGPVGSGKRYENWTPGYGATVRHPGTKGHFFFRRSFMETFAEARTVMARAYPRR